MADFQFPSDVDAAEAQARIYGDVLSACLSEEAFDGITLWGFTDRHSWSARVHFTMLHSSTLRLSWGGVNREVELS